MIHIPMMPDIVLFIIIATCSSVMFGIFGCMISFRCSHTYEGVDPEQGETTPVKFQKENYIGAALGIMLGIFIGAVVAWFH